MHIVQCKIQFSFHWYKNYNSTVKDKLAMEVQRWCTLFSRTLRKERCKCLFSWAIFVILLPRNSSFRGVEMDIVQRKIQFSFHWYKNYSPAVKDKLAVEVQRLYTFFSRTLYHTSTLSSNIPKKSTVMLLSRPDPVLNALRSFHGSVLTRGVAAT